jgi:hypothetical protein
LRVSSHFTSYTRTLLRIACALISMSYRYSLAHFSSDDPPSLTELSIEIAHRRFATSAYHAIKDGCRTYVVVERPIAEAAQVQPSRHICQRPREVCSNSVHSKVRWCSSDSSSEPPPPPPPLLQLLQLLLLLQTVLLLLLPLLILMRLPLVLLLLLLLLLLLVTLVVLLVELLLTSLLLMPMMFAGVVVVVVNYSATATPAAPPLPPPTLSLPASMSADLEPRISVESHWPGQGCSSAPVATDAASIVSRAEDAYL